MFSKKIQDILLVNLKINGCLLKLNILVIKFKQEVFHVMITDYIKR